MVWWALSRATVAFLVVDQPAARNVSVIGNATLPRVGKATLAWGAPCHPGNFAMSWSVTRLPTAFQRRTVMPALLIPVLWVGGAVVLLGGGYYIVQAMH